MNNPLSSSPTRGSFTSSAAPNLLRPRTNRLISGIDEISEEAYSRVLNAAATPFDSLSRAQSPIPSKHPSRSNSSNPLHRQPIASEQGSDLAASLSGLWGKSWTSLQGLASTVLGSDATVEPIKDNPQRLRRPLPGTRTRPQLQWGLSVKDVAQPGGGTKEQRTALVRAKKREELMRVNSSRYKDADRGPKRRTSDEFEASSAPPGEFDDRDMLIYIHHVTRDDTLPGISLKFGCSLQTVKQANRLWNNDGIHSRKTIVLPVDACTIKGRRVAGPDDTQESDLLSSDGFSEDPEMTPRASKDNPWLSQPDSPPHTAKENGTTLTKQPTPDDQPWRHDSWMLLTNSSNPTQLARIPRSELGFFPRARRKSVSYSDLDTPSSSFDIQRSSSGSTHPLPTKSSPTTNPTITISDPSATDKKIQHYHRRSSSTQRFAAQMAWRSGGVGTLGGKGIAAPGPPDDKFTKMVSKHIPGIIPAPVTIGASAMATVFDDDYAGGSGASTPTGTHTGLGIEQMGGAIEGWVRKLATRAARAVEPAAGAVSGSLSPRARTAGLGSGIAGPGGKRVGGVAEGDLIELSDAFELGEDEVDDEDRALDELEHERAKKGTYGAEERGRRGRAASGSGWGNMNEVPAGGLAVRERGVRGGGGGKSKGV